MVFKIGLVMPSVLEKNWKLSTATHEVLTLSHWPGLKRPHAALSWPFVSGARWYLRVPGILTNFLSLPFTPRCQHSCSPVGKMKVFGPQHWSSFSSTFNKINVFLPWALFPPVTSGCQQVFPELSATFSQESLVPSQGSVCVLGLDVSIPESWYPIPTSIPIFW